MSSNTKPNAYDDLGAEYANEINDRAANRLLPPALGALLQHDKITNKRWSLSQIDGDDAKDGGY